MTDEDVFKDGEQVTETSLSLLEKAKRRDREAWERLISLYEPLVIRWCVRFGLAYHDAENVSQELFMSVNRSMDGFRRQRAGSFRKWLRTIASRKCIDHMRKKHNSVTLDESAFRNRLNPTPEEANEEKLVLYQRAIELIRREYSGRDLEIFDGVIVKGRAPAAIAEDFGVSRNVVYLVVSRILRRLKSEFRDLIEIQNSNPE